MTGRETRKRVALVFCKKIEVGGDGYGWLKRVRPGQSGSAGDQQGQNGDQGLAEHGRRFLDRRACPVDGENLGGGGPGRCSLWNRSRLVTAPVSSRAMLVSHPHEIQAKPSAWRPASSRL